MENNVLITGGAGFIASNFILRWFSREQCGIVNLDKLTYAGNPENLKDLPLAAHYHFVQGDINDGPLVKGIFERFQPRAVLHFAAESHVDRSILGPAEFIHTNINGTFQLLQQSLAYWQALPAADQDIFRFLHVSTDEVYGSLAAGDPPFTEQHPYQPNSPYSASKAASDHLVRAYHHTYGFPAIITNCSNNYGPYQFPEKLIPLVIVKAARSEPLPVYGDGLNVRDWLYVIDHCAALHIALRDGEPGETYNIGGSNEITNLEVVRSICQILDEMLPLESHAPHSSLITFVKDRPGHDRRYAMDHGKIQKTLGWRPQESFATGIRKTVEWYLSNNAWISDVTSGAYQHWMKKQYAGT